MKRTFCIAGALLLFSSLGFAWFRASANFRSSPDAVTEGGGRSSTASYRSVQQAVGQTAGLSASASYRNRVGVVQPIAAPGVKASGWQVF